MTGLFFRKSDDAANRAGAGSAGRIIALASFLDSSAALLLKYNTIYFILTVTYKNVLLLPGEDTPVHSRRRTNAPVASRIRHLRGGPERIVCNWRMFSVPGDYFLAAWFSKV
jgi:hypothetical protein